MDLFSSPIGRLAFLGRHILALIISMVGYMILIAGSQHQSLVLIVVALIPEAIACFYAFVFAYFPRLDSIGLSRWFVLVNLIPVVNFLFLIFLLVCPAGWLIKRDEVA
jgi:hypothetical protein